VGVTKVAIVKEFVNFACWEKELRGGILSGSKSRVREREREIYVTEKKKTFCLAKCAKFSCDSD
jgi:hypothetical protein